MDKSSHMQGLKVHTRVVFPREREAVRIKRKPLSDNLLTPKPSCLVCVWSSDICGLRLHLRLHLVCVCVCMFRRAQEGVSKPFRRGSLGGLLFGPEPVDQPGLVGCGEFSLHDLSHVVAVEVPDAVHYAAGVVVVCRRAEAKPAAHV